MPQNSDEWFGNLVTDYKGSDLKMRTVFHWIMIASLLVLGLWAVVIFGQLFRSHMTEFLLLWFFIPVVAFWLNTNPVRYYLSISSLKIARTILFGVVIVLSFASFAHYDRVRDYLGQQFVEGYEVKYYEDSDDNGRPTTAADVSTEHWYSRFGLWLFEWIFLGACVVLPYVTWRASSRAVENATQQRTAHDDAG